ncbi:hypothetical protein A2U01_0072913, partial [Trifolium medium]|nr:hypothetical protein [Trifolium medium]
MAGGGGSGACHRRRRSFLSRPQLSLGRIFLSAFLCRRRRWLGDGGGVR